MSPFAKRLFGIMGRLINIHRSINSAWLINMHITPFNLCINMDTSGTERVYLLRVHGPVSYENGGTKKCILKHRVDNGIVSL